MQYGRCPLHSRKRGLGDKPVQWCAPFSVVAGIWNSMWRGGGLVSKNAVRVIVGGVAALALLVPTATPGWAADTEVTVSGVVRLDEKPTAGIIVCDLMDSGSCVTTGVDGRYSVVTKLHEVTQGGGTSHLRCLGVYPGEAQKGVFRGIGWNERIPGICLIPLDAEAGATELSEDLGISSYPYSWAQVVNRAGRPIAGASVSSGNGRELSYTDTKGRFRVRMGPYLYDQHYLRIAAKGYQDVFARYSPDGDLGRLVLAAAGDRPQYSVSGKVLDAKGQPYVGAKVCSTVGDCAGTVGEDGSYFGLLSAAPESNVFKIVLPGQATPVSAAHNTDFYQSNFATNVNFAMSSVRQIVGVTPRISGAPKVGKRLTVRAGMWLPQQVTLTCTWYLNSKVAKRGCSSLLVRASYLGKRFRVKVTGSYAGYASKVMASRLSSRVYR